MNEYRNTLSPFGLIGFEEIERALSANNAFNAKSKYPPHNVYEKGEKTYIELAVAGFSEAEIDIEFDPKTSFLTITGKKEDDKSVSYSHKGISSKSFSKAFRLAEYVEVDETSLKNGILSVSLVRNEPEDQKPKKIAIGQSPTPKQLNS